MTDIIKDLEQMLTVWGTSAEGWPERGHLVLDAMTEIERLREEVRQLRAEAGYD